MVEITGMPDIWSSDVTFLLDLVAPSFAKFAVSQSPYVVPDNLSEAIVLVDKFVRSWGNGTIITMRSNLIRLKLEKFFERCPIIEAWNHPKSGNEREFYSGDRYGSYQAPDDDIIDLGALAQNIAHDLTLWDVYERAHDA